MISSSTSFGLPKQSLNLKTQEFDYATLDTETRNVVQQRSNEIKERLRDSAQAAWEIGQRLVEVRDRLGYGRFYSWLQVEFEWSPRTAYNYISVFESFRSCATFSQVEIATSALYLLASPSTPEAARSEALERAKLGETITPSKAKEIASKHKKSAKPKAAKPVTVEVTAETIATSSTTSAEPEPAQHTKPSESPIDETAIAKASSVVDSASKAETVSADPGSADQTEEELLGKEETPLFKVGSEGQDVQTDSLHGLVRIEDELKQRAEHLGLNRSHNHSSPQDVDNRVFINTPEICKVLTRALPYFTNSQLDTVLQAITHRISEETLGLSNWSNIAGSQTDITSRKRAEQQLLHHAFHDALTGLPNRDLFMNRLEHAFKRAKRHEDYLFAVLFLAFDRFKVVNLSRGHITEDQLLIGIARRLEARLRPGDMVARLEEDEFTILLENIKDVEDATRVAGRIQKQLTLPFNFSGHEVFPAASIGIALSTTDYNRPEDLLHDAGLCYKNGETVRTGYSG